MSPVEFKKRQCHPVKIEGQEPHWYNGIQEIQRKDIQYKKWGILSVWSTRYNQVYTIEFRGDVKMSTYKPHTNHKKPSVSSHTVAPTTICDLSHNVYGSPLTDLGHISSVTYICHPLWFVCGHRKGILTSPLSVHHQEDLTGVT